MRNFYDEYHENEFFQEFDSIMMQHAVLHDGIVQTVCKRQECKSTIVIEKIDFIT